MATTKKTTTKTTKAKPKAKPRAKKAPASGREGVDRWTTSGYGIIYGPKKKK